MLTMMPSLHCGLNCPHCYLSTEQRRSTTRLSLDQITLVCAKVAEYYKERALSQKTIVCYWYGGEPTSVGKEYFRGACDIINSTFATNDGYTVKHTVLSSLIGVDDSWFDVFHQYCEGELQSSFDGLMRGANYLKHWERAIRIARSRGLAVSTISVVNHPMLQSGAASVLDYLADLGVVGASFLPFMLNDQNATGAYERFAPRMDAYSQFMIDLDRRYEERRALGKAVPVIGQREFVLQKGREDLLGNIAGQTLFLLPNGDFALPDYRGYQEFLQPFGNILTQSFAEILAGAPRRAYLRKQLLRNHNPECLSCAHASRCIMEFWKENRGNDDCFGARRYVEYLVAEHADQLASNEYQVIY